MRYFIAAILLALLTAFPAAATWKPEYGKEPPAVQHWYESAKTPLWNRLGVNAPAYKRLGIAGCCEDADRLVTKFVGSPGHEWSYYPDPKCTHPGCKLVPIPGDVIESRPIEPDKNDMTPLTPQEFLRVQMEFALMRREGVLFIHDGKPVCFWPPEPSL